MMMIIEREPSTQRPGGDTSRDWKGYEPAPVRSKPGTEEGSRKGR